MRISAFVVGLAILLSGVACGGDSSDVPDEVVGVVVKVDSEVVGQVTAFQVKAADRIYEIHIADDVEYSFPPGHLTAHLADALPVRVALEERDGLLYATEIEDAQAPGLGG